MRARPVFILPLFLMVAGVMIGRQDAPARAGNPSTMPRIVAEQGVPIAVVRRVQGDLMRIQPLVDADFPAHRQTRLTVRLYRSHASFARALKQLEGIEPEGSGDALGNVVHGILPLGPPNSFLEHNLVHVYTEWVLDQLTLNRSDRQPNPAWLYDGLAEWEADRRGAPLPCRLTGTYPLPLKAIAAPDQWWTTRAGINAGLEYCEARVAAGRLIRRAGWNTVRRLLSTHPSWHDFAARLERAATPR
jgi:hypothetical protein